MQGWIILGEVRNRGTFQGKFFVLPPVFHYFLGRLCTEWFIRHGVTECFLPDHLLDQVLGIKVVVEEVDLAVEEAAVMVEQVEDLV